MINFNVPLYIDKGIEYMHQAINNQKICGDGVFTKKCNRWLEERFSIPKALLTTSCTHALEMAAILAGIKQGDEVIAPSFTFVSTVNAFVLRGAKIKFVDIRPDTMNVDENLVEQAITTRTKAIIPVHYAGVSCEMDKIMDIAKQNRLLVVEDAAQGVMSSYKGKALGSIGDMAAYSFHETKNYTMGEGGAILLNHEKLIDRAEIIREKGTDRSKFFRGQVDKYSWVDIGSSYLPSDMNAAYLWAQLEYADEINSNRLVVWQMYDDGLKYLFERGDLQLPIIPDDCTHNAHMYYVKVKNLTTRTKLIDTLKRADILAVFHYIPLHSSAAGLKYGEFVGIDKYTTVESGRLLRLPLYYGIKPSEVARVIDVIGKFFDK